MIELFKSLIPQSLSGGIMHVFVKIIYYQPFWMQQYINKLIHSNSAGYLGSNLLGGIGRITKICLCKRQEVFWWLCAYWNNWKTFENQKTSNITNLVSHPSSHNGHKSGVAQLE